ncbi:hypothetical protein MYX76_17990 [Desulfobacterota bacterium AH_259_B03_O07]|nr:hypothetical protein [Desulfobacterota bacterium AH_259_B03_O07]
MEILNTQIVIRDENGSKFYEVHQEGTVLGGYDYTRDQKLSREECSTILENIILKYGRLQ